MAKSDAIAEKWNNFKHAFTSRKAFMDAVEVEPYLDSDGKINNWRNVDLSPTPPEKRTWGWINYVVFYFGVGFGNWTLGSSLIGLGLSWWQAIIAIFTSQMISSIAMYFNGRCGIMYHIGYPCVARSVFGMWGAYYFVPAKASLSLIWCGIQMYVGASLIDNMFRAIFGDSWTNLSNNIPMSQGITSSRMLCFFLFWLVHIGMSHLRPYQLTKFFWAKSILIIPGMLGLFIFCMANTNGQLGTLYAAKIEAGSLGWFFMYSINAGMGNSAAFVTNQPDMVRWSKNKNSAQWAQLIVNPLTVTLSASMGILATAAINNAWGLELWNQWDLMGAIMDRYWSPGTRCAIALCAFCWAFYYLGVNIAANMLPFGSDATMLAPRFMTIPRGTYIVVCCAWIIVPWKILASAAIFTQFLSGYGIFMGSVASIMTCEYYFLTNGNVFIESMYTGDKTNKHYYYKFGWNLQALFAYCCGLALPFPGFCGTLGASVSIEATHLNMLGWLLSYFVAFVVYYVVCKIFPTENQRIIKEMGLGWEEMASYEPFSQEVSADEVKEVAGSAAPSASGNEKDSEKITVGSI